MRTKLKYWLIVSTILMGIAYQSNAQKYISSDNSGCQLVIKKISLIECKIANSLVSILLDSALSRSKIENIQGHRIPSCKRLNITRGPDPLKKLILNTYNFYDLFDNENGVNLFVNETTMLLNYKGYQIVVDIEVNDSTILDYIKPISKKTDYFLYLFTIREANQDILCPSEPSINQLVEFHFNKNRYMLSKDDYKVTDLNFGLEE